MRGFIQQLIHLYVQSDLNQSTISKQYINQIENMYKPSLKRAEQPQSHHPQRLTSKRYTYLKLNPHLKAQSLIVPLKLVDRPTQIINKQSCLSAPLMAQPHKYPQSIIDILADECGAKVFGSYKHVNWLHTSRTVYFWTKDQQQCIQYYFAPRISCVTIGELKESMLPVKIRSKWVLCLGTGNQVKVYTLEPFSLKIQETCLRYCLQYSVEVQHIKIISNDKILICSDTGTNMIVNFQGDTSILKTHTPLYKKMLPIHFSQRTRRIQNVIYTATRLYILCTHVKRKSWLQTKIQSMIDEGEPQLYTKRNSIEIYQYENKQIKLIFQISEEQLAQKMQGLVIGNQKLQISSMSLNQNEQDSQLTVITTKGLIMSLRYTDRLYLTKDPIFMPNVANTHDGQIISRRPIKTTVNQQNSANILYSLGLNNLTITESSILFYSSDRANAISYTSSHYQLLEKYNSQQILPNNSKQWTLFTKASYYDIKQLTTKHIIIIAIFIAHVETKQQLPSSFHNYRFKQFMERMEGLLKMEHLLSALIEIITSNDAFIEINSVVYDTIYNQLRDIKSKNAKNQHFIHPNIKSIIIPICQTIIAKVWNLFFSYQLKEAPYLQQKRHITETDNFWTAIHNQYYWIVNTILQLRPSMFKVHVHRIENIFGQLKKLYRFIVRKEKQEMQIRKPTSINDKANNWYNTSQQLYLLNPYESLEKRNEINEVKLEKDVIEKMLSRNINQDAIKLHQFLKTAIVTTMNFISLFLILSQADDKLPTLKECITNPYHRHALKKAITQTVDFQTLQNIQQKMPELCLEKDLLFLASLDKVKSHKLDAAMIDIQQLGTCISSVYFKECASLLTDHYAIYLQVLQSYQNQLFVQRQALLKKDTSKQKHYFNYSLFPKEEEIFLNFQRQTIEGELEKIPLQKNDNLLSLMKAYKENPSEKAKQMDQVIEIALSRPNMLQHLVGIFQNSGIEDNRYMKLKRSYFKNAQKINSSQKSDRRVVYARRQIFDLK